jgi:hypothetical protein
MIAPSSHTKRIKPDFRRFTVKDGSTKFDVEFSARNGSWSEMAWLYQDTQNADFHAPQEGTWYC